MKPMTTLTHHFVQSYEVYSIEDVKKIHSTFIFDLLQYMDGMFEELKPEIKHPELNKAIPMAEVISKLRHQVSQDDDQMRKIWSRRLARDLVNWFSLTNPTAYKWRYNKIVLYAIFKSQNT